VIIKTFNEANYYEVELKIYEQLSSHGLNKHLAEYRGNGLYQGMPCIYLSRYSNDLQYYLRTAGSLSRNSVVLLGL
jgi:hypothetical protein